MDPPDRSCCTSIRGGGNKVKARLDASGRGGKSSRLYSLEADPKMGLDKQNVCETKGRGRRKNGQGKISDRDVGLAVPLRHYGDSRAITDRERDSALG